jgi:gamma-aminobutyric acid type B receptor
MFAPLPAQCSLNQLTTIRPVGLTFAAIIFLSSLGFGVWTFIYRNQPVVKKSQPIFLGMICAGTFLMGSTIIPLSIDDSIATSEACTKACMAAPWLFCVGFTTAFAAVFSKIWRLNRLLASSQTFRRVKLEVKDVLAPFVILLTLNIIFLLVWTIVDPMFWQRKPLIGLEDGLSTFGVCYIGRTSVSTAMISCLLVVALSVVILANYEAYKARKVSVEYSESKYVAMAMICFLQVIVVGVPLIVLVPSGWLLRQSGNHYSCFLVSTLPNLHSQDEVHEK